MISIGALILVLSGMSRTAWAAEIHEAVRAGDLAKVKALVAKDAEVVNEKDARGRTPGPFDLHNRGYRTS